MPIISCSSLGSIAPLTSCVTILAVFDVPFTLFGDLGLHYTVSVDVRHGLHGRPIVCVLMQSLVFRLNHLPKLL